jgi:hypothetical protein
MVRSVLRSNMYELVRTVKLAAASRPSLAVDARL